MSDQYAQMPAEPARSPVVRGEAPPPVVNAVRLMFVQAALGVLGLIVLLATKSSLKKAVRSKNPNFTAKELDNAVNIAVTIGVVIALIVMVLYVLLALQVRKGKNWARIVTWVVTGLGVASGLLSIAQPAPTLSRLVTLIGVVIDIAIIVFLAQRRSSEYFARRI